MSRTIESQFVSTRLVHIRCGDVELSGDLAIPEGNPRGIVLFVHGSGSSRYSPRNREVAAELWQGNLGTLLFDLLTPEEEAIDLQTGALRFDVNFLADRVASVSKWLAQDPDTRGLPIGYFGASTGAAAALVAAARQPRDVAAIVSRGGRPDLAGDALQRVAAPTLLIVGAEDKPVIEMNEQALFDLRCKANLEIIAGATHLFPEPGALQQVAALARKWFERHLRPGHPKSR